MTAPAEKSAAAAEPTPPSQDESPSAALSAPPTISTSAALTAPAKETRSGLDTNLSNKKEEQKEEDTATSTAPVVAAETKAAPEPTKPAQTPTPAPATASDSTTSPTTTISTTTTLPTAKTAPTKEAETADYDDSVNPPDFEGTVNTNNDLPSAETIAKIADYVLLDRDGKTHTFKSLYSGKHAARRVLIIFVRHFYCGVRFDPCPVLSCPRLCSAFVLL